MRQTVRVTSVPEPGQAEVFLLRQSACSGDCHSCGGCGAIREELIVRAENPIGAKVGDLVTIETETKTVLTAAFLVYLVPILLFFLGCWIGEQTGCPVLLGAGGFVLGIVPAVLLNRVMERRRRNTFRITGYAQEF